MSRMEMISEEEKEKIHNSTVAIGGIGGIGAISAFLCAKVGFGRIIVCDRDQYEVANIVEQFFASYETIGVDKTLAAKKELEKHSLFAKIEAVQGEILTSKDADGLASEADYLISGVDNAKARILLTRAAKSRNIPVVISANIGWTALHTIHMPEAFAYEQIYSFLPKVTRLENGLLDLEDPRTLEMINLDWMLFAICIGGFLEGFVTRFLKKEIDYYSYMAHPAYLSASLSVSELIKLITGKDKIICSPNIFVYDLLNHRIIDLRSFYIMIYRMREAYSREGIDKFLEIYRKYLS